MGTIEFNHIVKGTHEVFLQPLTVTGFVDDWPIATRTSAQETGIIWHVPTDWVSTNSINVVMIPDATETIQADIDVSVAAAGEDYNNDTRQSLNQTKAVTINDITEWDISGIGTLFATIAAGDYIAIRFQSDTDDLRLIGFRISWET